MLTAGLFSSHPVRQYSFLHIGTFILFDDFRNVLYTAVFLTQKEEFMEKTVETQDKPKIRVAIIKEAEMSPLGMGVTQVLTLYGDQKTLENEHDVLRTVQEWLLVNGRQRWSVQKIGRVIPLAEGVDDKEQCQTEVTILDTGL